VKADFLSLAAGPEQIHTIRLAKSLGWRVMAFDRNPQAPGLAEADVPIAANAADDVEGVVRRAEEAGIRALLPIPLGAMLEVAGVVNDRLGLPGISAVAARLAADKLAQRECLTGAGLPQPSFIACDGAAEILKAARSLGCPGIVKPRFGSGSSGVYRFAGEDEARRHLDWHLGSLPAGQTSLASLVESCVEGEEFGVDAAMAGGKFHMLAVRSKEMTPLPFRLGRGVVSPPDAPKDVLDAIEATCRTAAEVGGFSECLMNFDVIVQEQAEPIVIEMTGRPSGFNISALMLPAMLGFSPVEQMMHRLMGEQHDFRPRNRSAAILRMLHAAPGQLVSVRGLEVARSLPGVIAVESFALPGDMITRQDCGVGGFRVGYMLTVGNTLDEARSAWSRAAKEISFEVEE
jgi:biotin carboxylase